MKYFYSDKDIVLRIRVSYENQEKLKALVSTSASPLFLLKRGQFFNIRFEYKSFTCSYQGEKQEFSYRDVDKIETVADGLIIYLGYGKYISIATENTEKHNSELFDIAAFLKRHNRRIFSEREEIAYPEDAAERYNGDKEPVAKISFELSGREISRLLWHDYLIEEKMITLIAPIVIGFILSIILQNVWLAILSGFVTVLILIITVMQLEHKEGFIQNLKGILQALLYDDLLVVRLRHTDLELEYHSMRRLKNFFGLWRMKSGNFFVLTLPERIEKENKLFFSEIYNRIK